MKYILKAKQNLLLYATYVLAVIKSTMQYKLSFLLMVLGRFILAFNGFLGVYFLFSEFTNIKGYTYADILLCFSLIQISFALSECIGSGFATFSGAIKSGGFDRILLRPCSPILQIIGDGFQLGRIGPLTSALVMLIIGIHQSQIQWCVGKILTLAVMILGGTLLFIGLFMIGATVCFFSIEDTRCMNLLTYGAKEHGKYPVDVYGKGMMRFCTYIIPYALIQYYPLQYVLGKTERWQYGLYPFGTIIFYLLCYFFWRIGMNHYKSSGS